jgi:hypothetical protein
MVEILHVYLKKIHQLVSYVFSAENLNLVFFPNLSNITYRRIIRIQRPIGVLFEQNT